MIKHYLKVISREIHQNWFRFLLNTLGISVGLLIFSFTYFLLLKARGKDVTSFKNHDRIVQITNSDSSGEKTYPVTNDDINRIMRLCISDFETVATISPVPFDGYVNVERPTGDFLPHSTSWIRSVNDEFFDIFNAEFLQGNNLYWENKTAVLSKSFAEKLFGNENPIDKNIELTDKTHHIFEVYRVVGVIKDIYVDAMGADIYISDSEVTTSPRVFALLNNKSTTEIVNQQLKNIPRVNGSDSQLIPTTKPISQKKSFLNQYDPFAVGLVLLSLLVLLSAIINFFNILVSSYITRNRQLTLRKIAGASQKYIFRQLICEIIPVLFISLLMSISFTEILLSQFTKLQIQNFPGINLYPQQIYYIQLCTTGFILILSIVLIVIFLNKTKKMLAAEGMRGFITVKPNKKILRNISLGVQLFFAFFLLSSTILLFNYYQKINSEEKIPLTRSDLNRIFAVPLLDFTLPDHHQEIINKIKTINVVEEVLQIGSFMPIGESFDNEMQSYFTVQTSYLLPDSIQCPITIICAEDNYFSFFNLNIQGIDISTLAPNDAIVTQSLMENIKSNSDTGSIDLGCGIYHIAGVVEEMPFVRSVKGGVWIKPPIPDITPGLYVKSFDGSENSTRKELMSIIREFVPESIPYKIENLYENQERVNGYPLAFYSIIGIISFFSLILALFGIYSAITVDTRRKQKSVAIRKINGAGRKDIYWLFGKLYIILLGVSFIISSAIIVLAWNNLSLDIPLKYRPNILFSLIATLIIVALFTTIVMLNKLNRISKTNPIDVVKYE